MKKSQESIRRDVTEKMVAALSEGLPPWRQPWSPFTNMGWPCNFSTARRYNGINPLILWLSSMCCDYSSRNWGTMEGWNKVGALLELGTEPTYIVLWRMIPRRDPNSGRVEKDHHGKPMMMPLLREFPVYNVEQVHAPSVAELLSGGEAVEQLFGRKVKKPTSLYVLRKLAEQCLPPRAAQKPGNREELAQRIHDAVEKKLERYRASSTVTNVEPDFEPAEQFLKSSGAHIKHGGGFAGYNTLTDSIRLPLKSAFDSIVDYYETAFHELVHWTQKKGRVGIKELKDPEHRKQRTQYAFNELVAEIGACFLLMEIGVPMADKILPSAQSYVKGWISGMNNDSRFIFDAATQASKAVDYLIALDAQNKAA